MTVLEKPNYTQVPNSLFDSIPDMTEAELKCTMIIVRKIIGWHKDGPEPVSYTQLQKATGLSRQGVTDGIKAAVKRGYVKIDGKGTRGTNLYTLSFIDQSTQMTSTSQDDRPELVKTVDTQKKGKETTKEKDYTSRAENPKPQRKRSAKQLELDAMKNALADAFGMPHATVTGKKWDEFGKAGRELLDAGATPADMKPLHNWCSCQGWQRVWTSMAMAKHWSAYVKQRDAQKKREVKATQPTAQATAEAALYGEAV